MSIQSLSNHPAAGTLEIVLDGGASRTLTQAARRDGCRCADCTALRRAGMPLQADPAVKFALRDFSIKRIYEKHLQVESPYNTYRNKGLPPGPICTPTLITLDKVLQSPTTKYLYFVVSPDLSRHIFTENYKDHMAFAREFHKSMDERAARQRKAAADSSAAN